MGFTGTRWTLIRAAQAGDSAAWEAFVQRYRPPLIEWLRHLGAREAAEDLAQEVFLRLHARDVLERAEPRRGRFRDLLRAVARYTLSDHRERETAGKRGGGAVVASLGERDPPAPAQDVDQAFDRAWLLHLLELALERLREEYPHYHAAISGALLEERAQEQVGAELGRSRGEVKNWVHRGKQKLALFLREEVWRYAGSERECREELAALAGLLEGQ